MAEYQSILTAIENSIERFNKNIPKAQRAMFEAIEEELRRLEMNGKSIKATVKNLKIIASIKNKLNKLILSPEYIDSVKEFAKSFNEITALQNEYWRGLESTFKPRPLLREIRKAAIDDTVKALTETGITGITDHISDILRTNITAGGSMKALTGQLKESLLNTKTDGVLAKFAKTYTTDAINTYAAQYTETVSSDLGFTWHAWQGSEIKTSRGFCQAMVENHRYFHVSGIPNLLKGLDENGNKLKYEDNITKEEKSVGLNAKTGLPDGFKDGTNVSNFLTIRGGWNCGHQARPVPERNVKSQAPALYASIINSTPYKAWARANDVSLAKTSKPAEELPVKKEPPKPKPKGDNIATKYTVSKSVSKTANPALDAINEVHGVPDTIKPIPITKINSGSANGRFRSYTNGESFDIQIKSTGPRGQVTVVHEIGHHLDLATGVKGKFDSNVDGTGIYKVVEVAINSDKIQKLERILGKGEIVNDKGEVIPLSYKAKDYINYLLIRQEIWARAYAQYIATKSGKPDLRTGLETIIKDGTGIPGVNMQWDEKDFEKISEAIDLFLKQSKLVE